MHSFVSGHYYQTHDGVNMQAACDHNYRFLFLGILAGPGVMGDGDAVKMVALNQLIESMPTFFCTNVGNCAYTPTENLVPIYRGVDARRPKYDKIEMAFGLMVKKCGLLSRPLSIKMSKVKHLMVTISASTSV